MDVREKLVELLKNNREHYLATYITEHRKSYEEYTADHLVANGVTVQECGHWEIIMDDYDCEMMRCSVCRSEFYDGDNDTVDCLHNYCPHCGAKMMPQPPKGE